MAFCEIVNASEKTEDKCPIFPGIAKRWHVPFPDPAGVKGTDLEKLKAVRDIRDQIRQWLTETMNSLKK